MDQGNQLHQNFESACAVDMSRYQWDGKQYVFRYSGKPVERINFLFEGYVKGIVSCDIASTQTSPAQGECLDIRAPATKHAWGITGIDFKTLQGVIMAAVKEALQSTQEQSTAVATTQPSMLADAWAFLTDPDARKLSPFKYPSGAGMSVRDAKQQGLM